MNISDTIRDWRSLRGWRVYFIFFILGFLLYGRTLFFDFTYLDDNTLILENYPVISNIANIDTIFSSDVFLSASKSYYRPLLNLSFMGDTFIGGQLPVIFHLSNVFLHILAVILIFRLFLKWQGSRILAFCLALLFLIHPILTQAVAWIPGRNDSLLTVFVLASFLSFLNFCEAPRLRSYAAYLFFFGLALLTKETAVFLPVLIIFYFLFLAPRKVASSDRYLLIAGSAVVCFFWFLMRHFALGGETTEYTAALNGIAQNFPAIFIYLGKLLLPFNLAVFPILADSNILYGAVALVVFILAWLFSRHKSNHRIVFGWLWFFLFLLPSFIRINGLPGFLEHRIYLSFVGFLIFLAEVDRIKSLDFSRKHVKIVTAVIFLLLAGLTWNHSANFSDRLVFWRSAIASSPHSPLVQRNMGVMYYYRQDLSRAEEYYLRSLALNPREPMVHNNLGVIYLDRKEYARAAKEFREELLINPNYDKALANLERTEYLLFFQKLPQ